MADRQPGYLFSTPMIKSFHEDAYCTPGSPIAPLSEDNMRDLNTVRMKTKCFWLRHHACSSLLVLFKSRRGIALPFLFNGLFGGQRVLLLRLSFLQLCLIKAGNLIHVRFVGHLGGGVPHSSGLKNPPVERRLVRKRERERGREGERERGSERLTRNAWTLLHETGGVWCRHWKRTHVEGKRVGRTQSAE